MGLYFGTDGLRGIYDEEVSTQLINKCARSLCYVCKPKKIIVGRDTRLSGAILLNSLISAFVEMGIDIVDVGITTTPIVAFLTKELHYDFGVMITASHNPYNYNGIKIFDSEGLKISEELENKIEKNLFHKIPNSSKLGKYVYDDSKIEIYKNRILKTFSSLKNLKVVLDCSNGGAYQIASDIFKFLDANIIPINCKNDGANINNNCGAIHPESLLKITKEQNADIGFAFDGDADRVVCCDNCNNLFDGDDILYLLAKYANKDKQVVGTILSNVGLEKALLKENIILHRSLVGDKYVRNKMDTLNISLGGEPCGHIIFKDFATTGDGVLTAVAISKILLKESKPIKDLITYNKFPHVEINVSTNYKNDIIKNVELKDFILKLETENGDKGRIVVRASGTENKIRIMSEHLDLQQAEINAIKLKEIIEKINDKLI